MKSDSPFTDYVGIELEHAEGGECTATLRHRLELNNLNGGIHGGAIGTLADVCIGWAVRSTLKPGQWTATVELKTNFIAVAKGDMQCRARVVHRGRTLAVGEADVVDMQTGKLVAKTLATFAIRHHQEGVQ